jgi:hypothetical protein
LVKGGNKWLDTSQRFVIQARIQALAPNQHTIGFYLRKTNMSHRSSLFALLLVLLLSACRSTHNDSESEVQWQALRDAQTVAATGQLYICEAGTIAIYTPGITTNDIPVVRDLPRRLLPSGCTNPEAARSIAYAEAFNREILAQLRHKK